MTTRKKYHGMRSPILHPNVTDDIISRSTRRNSSHCMVADTILSQYPKFTHVSVDLQTIRFSDKSKQLRYIYLTPRVVQQALVLFDEGKKMKPFGFSLRGAQVVGMAITNRSKGVPIKLRVATGRRRLLVNRGNKLPDIVGGRPPKKHPSAAVTRTFGMRAFTAADLEDTKN